MEKGTKEAKLNPLQEKLKEAEANYKLAKTELELLLRNSGDWIAYAMVHLSLLAIEYERSLYLHYTCNYIIQYILIILYPYM